MNTITKESIAQKRATRTKRTPIGTKSRLAVYNKDPNYEYRFVNDVRDRVAIFQENGWEPVPASENQVGDKRVENPSTMGSVASVMVGVTGHSDAGKAVLMRIPKDWYAEDQAAKAALVDAREQTMKQEILSGHKGKFEIASGGKGT